MPSPREQLLEVVRELIAPLIRADGGEIYLVSVDDGSISLHLSGRYSGCPGNTLARRGFIEPLLGKRVPGARVSVTTGPLIPKGAEKV